MHTEELRAFLAVVETGSIKAAASALDASRATVRRRVEDLELRANTPLLERTRSGTQATPAGVVFAHKARGLLAKLDRLKQEAIEVGAAPSGTLRVLLPLGLPPSALTALIQQIRSRYPQLFLQMDFSYDPFEDLSTNIDLAVYLGQRLPRGAWISRTILWVRERLMAHPLYLKRCGTPEDPAALSSHRLFSWARPGTSPEVWQTVEGEDFPVSPTLVTPDVHMMRMCVESALGIGLMPDSPLLGSSPTTSALVPVMGDRVGRRWPVRLVWPEGMSEVPRIRAILDELAPLLKGPTI